MDAVVVRPLPPVSLSCSFRPSVGRLNLRRGKLNDVTPFTMNIKRMRLQRPPCFGKISLLSVNVTNPAILGWTRCMIVFVAMDRIRYEIYQKLFGVCVKICYIDFLFDEIRYCE